ncbi:MAG: NAD(P)H-dependent glycerol-3-phosphate dehydrogenase [Gammaproteobacteria bacterium]
MATTLIMGAGAWGTALAVSLARNDCDVLLAGRDAAELEALQAARENVRYLPGVTFPAKLQIATTTSAIDPASITDIILAMPCAGLRWALAELQPRFNLAEIGICLACKGLEPDSLQLNHHVVIECVGNVPVAVLSGPSFARELAAGLPTAVTLASDNPAFADRLQQRYHSEQLRIYTHDDVIGVEVGGAVKNVMAIAAGIADGLGFGANTRTALITRGLAEIMRLGVALGGKPETFMGLAGLGDLVLTCTDDQSRNRRLGLALAQGKTADAACAEIGQVVEGVRSAGATRALAKKHNIEMPITEHVVAVLAGDITPKSAVQSLLSRDPKPELG